MANPSLSLDPARTAVVIIDLQHGIASMPVGPHPAAEVIEKAEQLAASCAAGGGVVVPVHVGYSAGGGDRLKQPVDVAPTIPAGGFPPGWSDLVPPIAALPAAFRILKRQWSAFHGTELDLQLRRRGVDTIVLCGISTNFGVESTAREGWQHHYAIVVAEDACASANADMHRFAVEKILPRISRVRSTAEIVSAFQPA